jgi:ABC-type glycerol-3-phosphate transport system permease component
MSVIRRSPSIAVTMTGATLLILALGGYLDGWSWTGFRGNTLWDWLHLLVLPVTLAFLPLWLRTHQRDGARWAAALVCGAGALTVLAVGGYGFGWAWTGFRGNTLWDWLELLIVPFVLPAVLAYLTSAAPRPTADQDGLPRRHTSTP